MPTALLRVFRVTAPNQKWATDTTKFIVHVHKLHLSAGMDLYNGEVVAYRMAMHPVFEWDSLGWRAGMRPGPGGT